MVPFTKDSRGLVNSLYFSNNDFGVVATSRCLAILATKGLTSLRGQSTVQAQPDAGTSPFQCLRMLYASRPKNVYVAFKPA